MSSANILLRPFHPHDQQQTQNLILTGLEEHWGRLVLDALCAEAGRRGFRRVVLETTADWHEVVAFYQRYGFQLTHFSDSPFGREAHFCLEL